MNKISETEENSKKSDVEKTREMLKVFEVEISDKLNTLLNGDVAKDIFGVMSPLSVLANGDYYFVFILEQIGQKIQKTTGIRMNKMRSKIQKYTGKYVK